LSGCGSSGEETLTPEEDTPLGIRDFRIRADRDIVSTQTLAIDSDRVAARTGIPRGAALRSEFELMPDTQIEMTGIEGVVYTQNGVEVVRWEQDITGTLTPPQTRFHTLVEVTLEPGRYLIELQPQGRINGGQVSQLAQAQTDLTVVDNDRASGVTLPNPDSDDDGITEPHIGRPYAFDDVLSDGVAQSRTELYAELNPNRNQAVFPPPLAGLIVDNPLRPVSVPSARDLQAIQTDIPISISQTGTQTYTVRWKNTPSDSGVEIRYDRAVIAVTLPNTATVLDSGDADFVVSAPSPTQTTLVWIARAPITGIPVENGRIDSQTLWQQSFRIQTNPDPPLGPYATPTAMESLNMTSRETETSEDTPTEGTPTPTPLPTTTPTVHVSLQVGPLAHRTRTPIVYNEPTSGSIAAGGTRYIDSKYQQSPDTGIWATLSSQTKSMEVTPEQTKTWNRGNWESAGAGNDRTRAQYGRTGAVDTNERWQTTVGDPDRLDYTRAINVEPIIAEGLAFVGSNTGDIYAIDALRGDINWQVELADRVRVSPAYHDSSIYVGSNAGEIRALTAENGVIQWQTEIEAAITGDLLVTEETVYISDVRGRLHAFNRETGEKRWQRRIDSKALSTPTLTSNSIIVGSQSGMLTAVTPSDGTRRWQQQFGAAIETSPTVLNEMIITGTRGGEVTAINMSGERLWERGFEQPIRAPIATVAETTFITTINDIHAVTRGRGTSRWSRQLPGAVLGGPVVANRTVYVGTRDGTLTGLDTWSGRERFRRELNSAVGFSAPAVVDGVCVIGTVDGTVHGFVN
jgi:FOG: WD40-like repeat